MSKSNANHQNLSLYSKSDLSNIRKCVILFFSRLKEENCGSLSRILVSTEKTRRHHCATSNPRRKNGKESVNAPITGGIFIFFSLTDRRRKHMLQLIYNSMPPYTPKKYTHGAEIPHYLETWKRRIWNWFWFHIICTLINDMECNTADYNSLSQYVGLKDWYMSLWFII